MINKKYQGLKSMDLRAPWADSYSNKCLETPNFQYKTLSSKSVFSFVLHLYQSNKP